MEYTQDYFQNQISKSDEKIAWQYGTMVSFAGFGSRSSLRVLDAGCGAGPGLRFLTSRGHRSFGTDLIEYPLTVAHKLVPAARLARTDLREPLPFAPSSFDLILLSEVVEHLEDTQALLGECRRVLEPGGAIAATTPNLSDIRKYWQRGRWSGYVDKTHRRLFSATLLSHELSRAGFVRVRVKSGFKHMFWISSRKLRMQLRIPWPPYIGNTLIAVGYKESPGQAAN